MLGQFHDAVLQAVVDDEELITDATFVLKLDALATAITTVRVTGDVEVSREGEEKASRSSSAMIGAAAGGGAPKIEAKLSANQGQESRELLRETRRGSERLRLNFAQVARALRELAGSLSSRRIWFLLDEWSSVPSEIQPYLGEFLVRCVLPLQDRITVKIAAIEQQTHFREQLDSGEMIGIELGADVSANVDLDEFMVFEQNEERARSFFRGLLFKHITAGHEGAPDPAVIAIKTEAELIREGFTDRRAFDELVRAAEGVPRDAINIASRAALRALSNKISVPDLRVAAPAWFQNDKEPALRGRPEALPLLNWIIDRVIREKRARVPCESEVGRGAATSGLVRRPGAARGSQGLLGPGRARRTLRRLRDRLRRLCRPYSHQVSAGWDSPIRRRKRRGRQRVRRGAHARPPSNPPSHPRSGRVLRGAGPHDLLRMARRDRMLVWAGESQYYTEPKRLAKLGYLSARKAPGKTCERTVYTLTDKGLQALREYAGTPVAFTPLKSEPLIRLLICDLVGEEITRESMGTLRDDIADIERRLGDAELRAEQLPHREKYLRLVIDFMRRLLQLHLELVDRVEHELTQAAEPSARPPRHELLSLGER